MNVVVWIARGLGNQREFRELQCLHVEKDLTLLFLCELNFLVVTALLFVVFFAFRVYFMLMIVVRAVAWLYVGRIYVM